MIDYRTIDWDAPASVSVGPEARDSRGDRGWGRSAGWAVALAMLHFVWLAANFRPGSASPDANGYIVQARLFASTGQGVLRIGSPAQYVGIHWLARGDGSFASRYPPGLPALLAAAWRMGGFAAAMWVNPLLASGGVLLAYYLARRLVGPRPALAAALVVAIAPMANEHALCGDSHTAAGFFLLAGVLALLHFADDPGWRRGLLAGLCLGAVPTIRAPEAWVVPAAALWLLWRMRPAWRVWPVLAGMLPPLGGLACYNAAVFGSWLRSGYALSHESTAFSAAYFHAHLLSYLTDMGGAGMGLFFAWGAAGMAGLCATPRRRPDGLLFGAICVPLVLVYVAYYFNVGPANMRFLIPEIPFFAAAGVWLLDRVAAAVEHGAPAIWATVLGLQLALAGLDSAQTLASARSALRDMTAIYAWADRALPPGGVIIAPREIADSLDGLGRWRLVDEGLFRASSPAGAAARPAVSDGWPDAPNPEGGSAAQRALYSLPAPQKYSRLWTDIVRWAGDRPIYWITTAPAGVRAALPAGAYRLETRLPSPVPIGMGHNSLDRRDMAIVMRATAAVSGRAPGARAEAALAGGSKLSVFAIRPAAFPPAPGAAE